MPKRSKNRRSQRPLSRESWQVVRSPSTGDFGFPHHPWLRLNDDLIGLHHPAVMFDVVELRNSGYDPVALGFVRAGDHAGRFEIPIVDVVADMKSRYDIDLYETGGQNTNSPTMMIGGVFNEPHPDDWWERVHGEQNLIIMAGDTPTFARAAVTETPLNFGRILTDSYVARVKGLMIRAYDSGVGTHMPGA